MKKILIPFVLMALLAVNYGCKKKADTPPIKGSGSMYSVAQLKAIATCTDNCSKRFAANGNASFSGIVLVDELTGNFYKEIYVRDLSGNGAIRLDLIFGNTGIFVGDSIRVILNGLDVGVNSQTGMLEIDSVDFEKSIVKYGSGAAPQPKQINLSDISTANPYSNYLCDLVTINNVAFLPADTAKMWADAVGQLSINRTLEDCAGKQIVVRTSNYATFASEKTPKGFGSITGIATAYGSTSQLVIRTPKEVFMNGSGCVVYNKKNFNDNSVTSGGWTQQSVLDGNVNWTTSTLGAPSGAVAYGKISGFYSGTDHNAENWLISPSMDMSAGVNPVLSFVTASNYSPGDPLELYVSTNYTSGLPSTATWTQLTFTLCPADGWQWTSSGTISLSAFKSTNTRIAFRYRSQTSSATTGALTYEVDDIIIKEN
jgi:hypothetical protein